MKDFKIILSLKVCFVYFLEEDYKFINSYNKRFKDDVCLFVFLWMEKV